MLEMIEFLFPNYSNYEHIYFFFILLGFIFFFIGLAIQIENLVKLKKTRLELLIQDLEATAYSLLISIFCAWMSGGRIILLWRTGGLL